MISLNPKIFSLLQQNTKLDISTRGFVILLSNLATFPYTINSKLCLHVIDDWLSDCLIWANSSLVIPVVWCLRALLRAARIFHGILDEEAPAAPLQARSHTQFHPVGFLQSGISVTLCVLNTQSHNQCLPQFVFDSVLGPRRLAWHTWWGPCSSEVP